MPHRELTDPPRRRADKRRGHGTFKNDRPPVAATIGRESGRACLHVIGNSNRVALGGLVQATTTPGTVLNSDEWTADERVPESGRRHGTVDHGAEEWARDEDGDKVREVHTDTREGTWTGSRDSLRPFRGASEWFLAGYVAMFERRNDIKRATDELLALLLGRPRFTGQGS